MNHDPTVKHKQLSRFCAAALTAICSPFSVSRASRDAQRITLHAPRAFTLVEAVVALAILSIGIFVIVEATSRCLAVIRVSRNYQTARAVLDRYESEHPLQPTNAVSANFDQDEEVVPGFHCKREFEAVDGETKLYMVKTRVTWAESGQASAEEVVSYLYFLNEEK